MYRIYQHAGNLGDHHEVGQYHLPESAAKRFVEIIGIAPDDPAYAAGLAEQIAYDLTTGTVWERFDARTGVSTLVASDKSPHAPHRSRRKDDEAVEGIDLWNEHRGHGYGTSDPLSTEAKRGYWP